MNTQLIYVMLAVAIVVVVVAAFVIFQKPIFLNASRDPPRPRRQLARAFDRSTRVVVGVTVELHPPLARIFPALTVVS